MAENPPPVEEPAAGPTSSFSERMRPANVRQVYLVNDPAPVAIPMSRLALFNLIYGVAFLVVGIVAIIFPISFTFALDYVIGGVLTAAGIIAFGIFVFTCGAPGSWLLLVLGIIHFAIGIWLILTPAAGVVYLTLVLCGWFIAQGIAKMAQACHMRGSMPSWPAVFSSGALSIVLGFWILVILPENAVWVLGVLFGVDMLVTGVAALLVALMIYLGLRQQPEGQEPLLPEAPEDIDRAVGNV